MEIYGKACLPYRKYSHDYEKCTFQKWAKEKLAFTSFAPKEEEERWTMEIVAITDILSQYFANVSFKALLLLFTFCGLKCVE